MRLRYDPAALLERRLPHVGLFTLRLPAGRAWWLPTEDAIVLDDRLDSTGRRVALAHEVEHALAGDEPIAHVWFHTRQERQADVRACRRLITLDDLIDALRVSRDEQHLAELLDVDVPSLRLRLDRITPREQLHVEQALAP